MYKQDKTGNAFTIQGKREETMKKKYGFIMGLCILAVLAAVAAYGSSTKQKDPLQPEIANKILRFHVLANSDSKEDQEVKIKVRDAIGNLLEPKLQGAKSRNETERIVKENMPEIITTAEWTLEKNGYHYGATARVADVDFPDKTYGAYTFPKGNYRALQITLGKGNGHNWWCVLYPNMCFQGSVYEVVDESSEKVLREVLTQEEYADVFDSGKIQIRWKFLDYFH